MKARRSSVPKTALMWAVDWLSRRDHSAHELRQKWAQKEVPREEAEQALKELQERGWQSDVKFAHSRARMRLAQGKSRRYIEAEMQQHGISKESWSSFWEDMSEDRWGQQARKVSARFGPMPWDRETSNKARHWMLRRGMTWDEIKAIESHLGEA